MRDKTKRALIFAALFGLVALSGYLDHGTVAGAVQSTVIGGTIYVVILIAAGGSLRDPI